MYHNTSTKRQRVKPKLTCWRCVLVCSYWPVASGGTAEERIRRLTAHTAPTTTAPKPQSDPAHVPAVPECRDVFVQPWSSSRIRKTTTLAIPPKPFMHVYRKGSALRGRWEQGPVQSTPSIPSPDGSVACGLPAGVQYRRLSSLAMGAGLFWGGHTSA